MKERYVKFDIRG